MRASSFLIGVALCCGSTCGQSLSWAWAWAAGGSGSDRAMIDVAPTGEVHVLGTYADTIDANGVPLMSAGETDLFVQRLDPADGAVLWTAEAHNPADMEIFDIAYRSTGELVVCGFVYHDGGEATFGPFTIPGLAFGNQAFIAGLSPSGSWTWLTTVPGPVSSTGTLVEVDGNDDILLQCGVQRVQVQKFTGAGVPVWEATASSSDGSLDGYAMDVLPDGSLVLTGRFHDTGTFGTIQLNDPTIYYDAFIAKLSAAGTWEWAVQAGGSHWDKGFGVQATATGDVFVLGTFRNTATFGPYTHVAAGPNDLWVAKLTGSGEWLWVNPAASTVYMEVYDTDLSVDGSRMAIIGTYAFGTTMIDGQVLPAPATSSNDIYVAELDTLGNFTAAKACGSESGDLGLGVAYDTDGHIFASGSFNADMMLDNINLAMMGTSDLWVGRLDPGLVTNLPHVSGTSGAVSLSCVDDQLVVSNGTGQPGSIHLFDALGRPLQMARHSAAPMQTIALEKPARGLLCWRAESADGTVRTGAVVR